MKNTGTVPLLVIEILCDYLKDTLHSTESLLGFPYPLFDWKGYVHALRVVLDSQARQLLSAISLVHPSWTKPARDAVKTRLSIDMCKDHTQFERSTLCGPWVRELQLYDESAQLQGPQLEYPDGGDDSDEDSNPDGDEAPGI